MFFIETPTRRKRMITCVDHECSLSPCQASISATASMSHAGWASREARCRAAVFTGQLAEHHTRPASRGTRRATAVKPRPACFSSSTLRACSAQSGVQGYYPYREPLS